MHKASERRGRALPFVAARRSSRDWPAAYARWLVVSDILVVLLVFAVVGAIVLPSEVRTVSWPGGLEVPYFGLIVIIQLLWLLALSVFDTRARHIVGNGSLEYGRIANAGMVLFALLVSVAFFLRIEVSRALLLIVIPVGTIVLIASRWMWRQWLRGQQRRRKYVYRAVVLGEPKKAAHIITAIRRTSGTGLDIVGVVTHASEAATLAGVPIVGAYEGAIRAMDAVDADTVIIAGSDEVDPGVLRRLGWALADRDANLVVAPQLTDVAGPRIHSRPAAGLPLVYVDYPALEGYRRFVKRAFDLTASAVLLILASPLFLAVAIAIRLEGPGPILYHQLRVGRGGRQFRMLKFRSMVPGADEQLDKLLDEQNARSSPLHKVIDDPRVTRVGRFLRRHSLDEFPQLINVFVGTMSLVGPRPQREAEVALYDDAAERRLLVKPGMSGLWQVSGRSRLSWEDALRLDLYYVENWSFTQDLQILFRTIRAVLAPGDTAH